MKRLAPSLFFILILPAVAWGQPNPSDWTAWHKNTASHLEGVSVSIHHSASNRAVEAESQIKADVEEAIRRSNLTLHAGTKSDQAKSNATLNFDVETDLRRNESMGFYIGEFSLTLYVSQRAVLDGGQEVTARTYEIDPITPSVLSGRGEALAYAQNLDARTGMSESGAIVTSGGPRKMLEIARRYVRAMTQRFIQDWREQASR